MTKPACKSQMASPFASGFSKHLHPGAKTLMPNCHTCSKACQQAFCKRSLRAINGSPSRHFSMTMHLTACISYTARGTGRKHAGHNPDVLQGLLQQELQAGWIRPFTGDAKAAPAHWLEGTAMGKLNIVMAEGKDPRLVPDSTVCNANTLRKVPERVQLPTALDVQRTFQRTDKFGQQQLGNAGILCGWALRGYSAAGRCSQFLRHVYISEARSMHKHFGSTTHH